MSQKLSKRALFVHFAERFTLNSATAQQFFDELTALAERELRRCGEFAMPGLVALIVRERKARVGRNPATGESMHIPPRTAVGVRVAAHLKKRLLAHALPPPLDASEETPGD